MAGLTENRPAFVLPVTWKFKVWPDSLAGPAEIFVAQLGTVCAPALLFTVWSAPLVNDGASFPEFTVIVKVCDAEVSTPPLAVPPLSWSVRLIVAEPLALAAGV